MDNDETEAKKMWDAAREHDGRYLLPRRYTMNDPEKNVAYKTADWLVSMRYARWIPWGSSFAPGIELTGRPWRETPLRSDKRS